MKKARGNRQIRYAEPEKASSKKSGSRKKSISAARFRDRTVSKRWCIYGVLPVVEKLRSQPAGITKILASAAGGSGSRLKEITELARRNGIPVEYSDRGSLAKIIGEDVNHQGVVALASAVDYADADVIIAGASEPGLFLVLDGIEDPRNLGAVLRTAEGSGVDGVFIPERRAVGLTEAVAKSSAGAVEHVRVARVPNLNRLIDELKERNIWVIGASADAETNYTDWDWKRPSALVLGNEGTGLHRLVAENCDVLVNVPMYGRIDSLNVSVAAGVILFEARRQRRTKFSLRG